MYSSSVGQHALLIHVSCNAVSVACCPTLLINLIRALLLGFSLIVGADIGGMRTSGADGFGAAAPARIAATTAVAAEHLPKVIRR